MAGRTNESEGVHCQGILSDDCKWWRESVGDTWVYLQVRWGSGYHISFTDNSS